jgi:hypothetical protein
MLWFSRVGAASSMAHKPQGKARKSPHEIAMRAVKWKHGGAWF